MVIDAEPPADRRLISLQTFALSHNLAGRRGTYIALMDSFANDTEKFCRPSLAVAALSVINIPRDCIQQRALCR